MCANKYSITLRVKDSRCAMYSTSPRDTLSHVCVIQISKIYHLIFIVPKLSNYLR